MVGELLKTYPQKGTINFDIEENSPIFNDLIIELKKLVKKHSDQSILPIECLYLNKNALNSIIGTIPPPTKHFNLKKNPKSFALRSDLLHKSNDAALNLKKGNLGPIRNRSGSKDLNDQTPLKGIPRSLNTSQFKMPTIQNRLLQIGAGRNPTRPSMPGVRKDVAIKFLDQPVSIPDAKKKKKTDKEQIEQSNKSKDSNDKSNIEQTPTHYAAGLADYVPPSPAVHSSSYNDTTTTTSNPQPQPQDRLTTNDYHEPPQTNPVFQANLSTPQLQPMNAMPYTQQLDTSISNPADQMHLQPQNVQPNLIQQQQQQQQQTLQNQPPHTVKKTVTTLTKQQADELRMISKTYPVGKNELSLIISFMSGNRVNPNAEDIVRVKLGEKRELARQPDGSLVQIISDGWYQMNYRTGESFQVTTNKRINSNITIQQQPTL